MSLLDKQEVQDICGHTALRARKWSFLYVNERQTIRHYRARSTEGRRRNKNATSRFFYFARSPPAGAYVKLRYIAILYTHSIGNQP